MGTVSMQKRRRRGRGRWDGRIVVALATGEKYYAFPVRRAYLDWRPERRPYVDWAFRRAPASAPLTPLDDTMLGRLAAWASVHLALRHGTRPPAAAVVTLDALALALRADAAQAAQLATVVTLREAAAVAEAAWDAPLGDG